jgi:cytochrome c
MVDMKKAVRLFLVFSCLAGTISFAHADDALLIKSNCLACHSVDKRKYGPTFNEVAAKYANDDKSAKKLAKKIKAGGTGVWGVDVMPAQPKLSQADALILAKYVLSLK